LPRQLTWWILALPVAMLWALAAHSFYLLDYTHVLAGAMWTGADLFLGFILAPVLRRLAPEQRKTVINWLVPRTLLYMPVVAATTGTAGWYLAGWDGFLSPAGPRYPWIVAALAILTVLTLQGLGVMLPNNVRIYLELRRSQADLGKIVRLNRINMFLAGSQGILQVAVILVMARLAVG
jgi:uncharacterized membrane protein